MRIILIALLLSVAVFSQTLLTETFSKFTIDTVVTHAWIFDSTFHADTDAKAVTANLGTGTTNLTAHGSPALNIAGSPIYSGGKVYKSDGTDDHFYVVGAGAGELNVGAGSFTIAMWINIFSDPAANAYAVNKRNAGAYYSFRQVGSNDEGAFETNDGSTTKAEGTAALGFNQWYYIVCVRDNTNNILTTYLDAVQTATPTDITGYGNLDNSNNFAIGTYGGNAGTNSTYPMAFAQVVLDKTAWSAKKIKEEMYLADGWAAAGSDVPGITRASLAFHQGIVADTVYYATVLTAGSWSVTVNVDGAAGGESLKVLTSADASTWSTISTITATTEAINYTVRGSGLGYIGFGLASGTVYIDDVTVQSYSIPSTGKVGRNVRAERAVRRQR